MEQLLAIISRSFYVVLSKYYVCVDTGHTAQIGKGSTMAKRPFVSSQWFSPGSVQLQGGGGLWSLNDPVTKLKRSETCG